MNIISVSLHSDNDKRTGDPFSTESPEEKESLSYKKRHLETPHVCNRTIHWQEMMFQTTLTRLFQLTCY